MYVTSWVVRRSAVAYLRTTLDDVPRAAASPGRSRDDSERTWLHATLRNDERLQAVKQSNSTNGEVPRRR